MLREERSEGVVRIAHSFPPIGRCQRTSGGLLFGRKGYRGVVARRNPFDMEFFSVIRERDLCNGPIWTARPISKKGNSATVYSPVLIIFKGSSQTAAGITDDNIQHSLFTGSSRKSGVRDIPSIQHQLRDKPLIAKQQFPKYHC